MSSPQHGVHELRLLPEHILEGLVLKLAHILFHEPVVQLYGDAPVRKGEARRLRRADERARYAARYLHAAELFPGLAGLTAALVRQRAVRPAVEPTLEVTLGLAVSYHIELHISDLSCSTGRPLR